MEWVEEMDYRVDPHRAQEFADFIRTYWPQLEAKQVLPAYAGIRPKISQGGEAARTSSCSGPLEHGFAGIVNLFGMDSSGLTASLAIGNFVAAMLK